MNPLKVAKAVSGNIVGGIKTTIGGIVIAGLGTYFTVNNTLENQLYSIGLILIGALFFFLPDGKKLKVNSDGEDNKLD